MLIATYTNDVACYQVTSIVVFVLVLEEISVPIFKSYFAVYEVLHLGWLHRLMTSDVVACERFWYFSLGGTHRLAGLLFACGMCVPEFFPYGYAVVCGKLFFVLRRCQES